MRARDGTDLPLQVFVIGGNAFAHAEASVIERSTPLKARAWRPAERHGDRGGQGCFLQTTADRTLSLRALSRVCRKMSFISAGTSSSPMTIACPPLE
jgi:hypothetical protein